MRTKWHAPASDTAQASLVKLKGAWQPTLLRTAMDWSASWNSRPVSQHERKGEQMASQSETADEIADCYLGRSRNCATCAEPCLP